MKSDFFKTAGNIVNLRENIRARSLECARTPNKDLKSLYHKPNTIYWLNSTKKKRNNMYYA